MEGRPQRCLDRKRGRAPSRKIYRLSQGQFQAPRQRTRYRKGSLKVLTRRTADNRLHIVYQLYYILLYHRQLSTTHICTNKLRPFCQLAQADPSEMATSHWTCISKYLSDRWSLWVYIARVISEPVNTILINSPCSNVIGYVNDRQREPTARHWQQGPWRYFIGNLSKYLHEYATYAAGYHTHLVHTTSTGS